MTHIFFQPSSSEFQNLLGASRNKGSIARVQVDLAQLTTSDSLNLYIKVRSEDIPLFYETRPYEWRRKIAKLLERDKNLGIERESLSFLSVFLPNTPEGEAAGYLIRRIDEIAAPEVFGDTHGQNFYFLYQQEMWGWRGLLLAHKIYGAIPDPTEQLWCNLNPRQVEELEIVIHIDKAIFDLIVEGENLIRSFAETKGKNYPFKSPLDLFLQTMEELFHWGLSSGPLAINPDWNCQKKDRDNRRGWLTFLRAQAAIEEEKEEEYFKQLKNCGWRGLWVRALWKYKANPQFSHLWRNYIEALKAGNKLYNPAPKPYWKDGNLYLPKKTKQKSLVSFEIDKDKLRATW